MRWTSTTARSPLVGGRKNKILVNRKHRETQPVQKGASLERVHIRGRLVAHLPVQDFHALKAELRRVVNDLFNRVALAAEVPIRICRNRQPDPPRGRRLRARRGRAHGRGRRRGLKKTAS